jgi:uncharacterized protein YkwD
MTFRRSIIVLTLVVAVIATAAGPARAETPAAKRAELRNRMFQLVNRSRVNHGRHRLHVKWPLNTFALRHTRRMVRRNTVYHSADVWDVVRKWDAHCWGENVGMAGTVRRLERLFMHSPEHRANILSSHFHRIGVGVVRARGRTWVTLDFYG